MKTNRLLVISAMLAALALAAIYAVRQGNSPATAVTGGTEGQLAPDFALQALDGRTVRLSELRGKAVVVNFWATWCTPCKIEMPWLSELQKKYGPDGLEIIGITMDADAGVEKIKKFTDEVGTRYTIVLGDEQVGDAYGGAQFLPATFYVDKDGRIVKRVFGIVSFDEIEKTIQSALAENTTNAR